MEVNGLRTLIAAINARMDLYKDLLGTVRQKKVRLLALHAVFRFSERGSLQLGSLAVGSVIVLGMFYMWFYYQAAAGQFVHRYWTLDDLIIQGINAVWLIALVLSGFEFLFRWLLRGFELERKYRTQICAMSLNHPNWLVAVLLLLLFGVTSVVGQWSGRRTYDDFVSAATRNGSELQSATMTDGTILKQVHLVGTTSRTAVFLQQPADDGTNGDFDVPPGYIETWREVIGLFPLPAVVRGLSRKRETGRCSARKSTDEQLCGLASNGGKYRVLVVDRAHVLCHTRGTICENLPKREGFGEDD